MLRKLLSAKRTNYAQVARRKEPLEYPENQTISYQTFMKITMDLDGIGLDTISFQAPISFFFFPLTPTLERDWAVETGVLTSFLFFMFPAANIRTFKIC